MFLSSDISVFKMKHFNYPVEQLIKGVSERPVIWDKTLEIYKDREERKQAWEDIFRCLEDGYDEMTRENKRTIGKHLMLQINAMVFIVCTLGIGCLVPSRPVGLHLDTNLFYYCNSTYFFYGQYL